jgi:class 3 adenylate cyclase
LKADLESVYRRIDGVVSGGAAADPFERAPEVPPGVLARLDERIGRIVAAGVPADVAGALRTFLAEAPAPELARIRPLALARRLGLDPDATVAACLRAVDAGLLVLLWDLLCPLCRGPAEVKDTLRAIADHGRCEACRVDYPLDFAQSVELVFRSHPQVREADTNTYCAAGPAHSPHVVAQVRLAPGERLALDLNLDEGVYRLRGPQLGWTADFRVEPGAASRRLDVDLAAGPEAEASVALATTAQVLTLLNPTDRPLVARVERTANREDALTAARASSLALFRELFPGEVLAPGRLVSVATVYLLQTGLGAAERSLYDELGDPGAYDLIEPIVRAVEAAARGAGGTVVKTVGEGALASFGDADAAVRAALEVAAAVARSTGDAGAGLLGRFRAVVHGGPALAATIDDRLDYFGATVHDAARLLAATPAGTLALSRVVASDPPVAARLGRLAAQTSIDDADPRGPLARLDLAAVVGRTTL